MLRLYLFTLRRIAMSAISQVQAVNQIIERKGIDEFVDFLMARFKFDGDIQRLGPSGRRINPCPVCGHRDCFTFSMNGVFHCFSCQTKGSAFFLPRLFTNSPSLASSALQEFTGVSMILDSKEKDRQRKAMLYAALADIYHQQLLETPAALDFLMQVRKRQLETIRVMKTGFVGDQGKVAETLTELG